MDKLLYFAYGSNLHPDWLSKRVGMVETVSSACLQNWKLYFHKLGTDGSAKCNIIKTGSPNDWVHGVIYQVNPVKKPELDKAEGGYTSVFLNIAGFNNILLYLAEENRIVEDVLPYSWYHDIVIAGAKYHQLSRKYLAYIESFQSITDPDQLRDKINRDIIWPDNCSKY